MQTTTLLGLVPLILLGFWYYTSYTTATLPTLRGQRVCLLIAHPDDEAMFFAPTLLALTRPELQNHVRILCLSSGNADGLGATRRKEILASGARLGIREPASDILVLDDANFPDSMSVTWSPRLLANLLTTTFAPAAARSPATMAPPANIDALITFDAHGVSAHPNHIACRAGAAAFVKALMHGKGGWECPVALYTLASVSLPRKYMGMLDAPVTLLRTLFRRKRTGKCPSPIMSVSGPADYWRARGAMALAHKSQMRWFRWGWISVGRYMFINEIVREKVV